MAERVSHYLLLEKLGSGGMGTVHRAQDELSGGIVALKTLHPHLTGDNEFVKRFEREARIAGSIDSPNVVRVLDSGFDNGVCFLVMEYVPGQTLAQLIQASGRLSPLETASIAASVARGLSATHARGIVHRDVSPQNVIISPDGRAKLTDFGISRDLADSTMTSTGMLVGKHHYIAPEVFKGSKPDVRSDIYALGVVMFQMLAGEVPFTGETPYAVLQKHVTEEPPQLKGIRSDAPDWLIAIANRCLVKDPDARYQDPADLVAAIETGGSGSMARPNTSPPTAVSTSTPAPANLTATTMLREPGSSNQTLDDLLSMRVHAKAGAGATGEYELVLRNLSDRSLQVELDAYDEADQLNFRLRRSVDVPAASIQTVALHVQPASRRLVGGRRRLPFTVAASGRGGDAGGPKLTATSEFEDHPLGWPVYAGGGGVLAVCLLLLFGGGVGTGWFNSNQPPTPEGEKGGVVQTPTLTPPPTATPVPPVDTGPRYVATWEEPRANSQVSNTSVAFRSSYAVGTDKRPVARMDFNVWTTSGWYRACSAFAPNGPARQLPGGPLYSYECAANLSGGPFGVVTFTFDFVYSDGTPMYNAGGELRVTRDAPPPPPPPPPPTPTPIPGGGSDFVPVAQRTYSINRVLGTNSGVETTATTIEYQSGGRLVVNVLVLNTARTSVIITCGGSPPMSYATQQGATLTNVDSYCKANPNLQYTLAPGQSRLQWIAFSTSNLAANKPITFDVGGWGRFDATLR